MSDTLPSPCTRGVELPRPCTRVPPRPCTRGPDSPCVCAPKQRTRLTSVHNSNGLCVGAPGERWCARPWARGLVCPLRRALGRDPSHCWSHRPHEENRHGRESIPSPAPSHIGPTKSQRMRKKTGMRESDSLLSLRGQPNSFLRVALILHPKPSARRRERKRINRARGNTIDWNLFRFRYQFESV